MLSVVPVTNSISTTPAMTAGTVETVTSAKSHRLKVGRQQQKHGDDGEPEADRRPRLHFAHRRNLAADFDLHAGGRCAGSLDGAGDFAARLSPRSVSETFAVSVICRRML